MTRGSSSSSSSSSMRQYSLLIRRLNRHTSPQRLKEIFSRFGEIKDVYVPLDYYTKRPRGFGFVEFFKEKETLLAMEEMDATEIDGSVIEITMAKRGRSSPDSMRNRQREGGGGDRRDMYGRSGGSGTRRDRDRVRSRSRERGSSRYGGRHYSPRYRHDDEYDSKHGRTCRYNSRDTHSSRDDRYDRGRYRHDGHPGDDYAYDRRARDRGRGSTSYDRRDDRGDRRAARDDSRDSFREKSNGPYYRKSRSEEERRSRTQRENSKDKEIASNEGGSHSRRFSSQSNDERARFNKMDEKDYEYENRVKDRSSLTKNSDYDDQPQSRSFRGSRGASEDGSDEEKGNCFDANTPVKGEAERRDEDEVENKYYNGNRGRSNSDLEDDEKSDRGRSSSIGDDEEMNENSRMRENESDPDKEIEDSR